MDIAHPDALDPEELEVLTLQLREELLDLGVERVEPAREGAAPPGTRAVDALAIGGLLVTVTKASGPLLSVLKTIESWLGRNRARGIHIVLQGEHEGERAELEASGLTPAEQRRLIDAFLAKIDPGG